MVNFFLRLYDILHQRKALFTGLLLGLVMTLLVMMLSLSYNENIYDFLPLSGNEQKAINIYQDISGGQRIYTLFKTKDGKIDRDRLAEAVDTFAQKINSPSGSRHINEITTQIDYDKYAGITDFIYQVTEVVIYPVRCILERCEFFTSLPLDLSFFVTFILLSILQTALMA